MWQAHPRNKWEYTNRHALHTKQLNGFLGVRVNTAKADYHDIPYKRLDSRGRRKWENMLVLAFAEHRLKIKYEP